MSTAINMRMELNLASKHINFIFNYPTLLDQDEAIIYSFIENLKRAFNPLLEMLFNNRFDDENNCRKEPDNNAIAEEEREFTVAIENLQNGQNVFITEDSQISVDLYEDLFKRTFVDGVEILIEQNYEHVQLEDLIEKSIISILDIIPPLSHLELSDYSKTSSDDDESYNDYGPPDEKRPKIIEDF